MEKIGIIYIDELFPLTEKEKEKWKQYNPEIKFVSGGHCTVEEDYTFSLNPLFLQWLNKHAPAIGTGITVTAGAAKTLNNTGNE